MNKKTLIWITLLVAVVVAGAVWLIVSSSSSNQSKTQSTVQPTGNKVEITYESSGFSPSSVTAKAGDTVVIKNNSSTDMQFDSDPHPIHTANPELNVGAVQPGGQKSFVVDTKGTFGYHNHFNPSQRGTIIVQ